MINLKKRSDVSSCGLSTGGEGVEVRDPPGQDLWGPISWVLHLMGDFYTTGVELGEPMELAGGEGDDIKDSFLEEALFTPNCENRQSVDGIGGKEGSHVSKDLGPAPCPSPHAHEAPEASPTWVLMQLLQVAAHRCNMEPE